MLVVDEAIDTADLLCVELEELGHDCRSACGGAEAVTLAERFDPHVVVLDSALQEVATQLPPHVVVVPLSGRARSGARLQLVKPVAVATLRHVMSMARAG